MENFLHQGWMNEIYNYDPETYHATLTHSVFVRLEGGQGVFLARKEGWGGALGREGEGRDHPGLFHGYE